MGLAGRKSFLREQRYIREQRVQIMAFDAVLHDRNEKKKQREYYRQLEIFIKRRDVLERV